MKVERLAPKFDGIHGGNTMRRNKMKLVGLISAVAVLGISSFANAGKIISIPTPAAPETLYFGGWNLDNVEVKTWTDEEKLTQALPAFDEDTGAYSDDYLNFDSEISNDASVLMGILHGKDYPVGEPSGIKVVNDDNKVKFPKPQNCIVTTSYDPFFLDTATPEQVICSHGFQTHKRFKVNMLANSLDTNGGAVDLVFNVEPDGTTRDYQVFQKMNNYTGSRLEGFRLEVGTGVGAGFVKSTDTDPGFVNNLSIFASLKTGSDPETGIWDPDELATFSHGLFGPEDLTHTPPHFPTDGFFDDRPAGFFVTPTVQGRGTADTLTSGAAMPNNYVAVPVPNSLVPIPSQFGPWLHDEIAPSGVFFDDDNDPTTDAALLAFWGNTGDDTYAWMYGNNHVPAFAEVDAETLNGWASNPVYFVDVIEDMLNLGLNYVVSIGTVDATWPTWEASAPNTAEFTIRMTPIADTSGIGDPGYTEPGNEAPDLIVTVDEGTVTVDPSPEFDVGEPLLITVADGNTDEASVHVRAENLTTSDIENSVIGGGTFAMVEVEGHVGLYQGELATSGTPGASDDGTLTAEPGDLVMITYFDADLVGSEPSDQTTAAGLSTFFVIPLPGGGAAVIDL